MQNYRTILYSNVSRTCSWPSNWCETKYPSSFNNWNREFYLINWLSPFYSVDEFMTYILGRRHIQFSRNISKLDLSFCLLLGWYTINSPYFIPWNATGLSLLTSYGVGTTTVSRDGAVMDTIDILVLIPFTTAWCIIILLSLLTICTIE